MMKRLQALIRRIDVLISIRAQEINRIDISHERPSVRNRIGYLDQEVGNLKKQIATHITSDPNLKTKRNLLKTPNTDCFGRK